MDPRSWSAVPGLRRRGERRTKGCCRSQLTTGWRRSGIDVKVSNSPSGDANAITAWIDTAFNGQPSLWLALRLRAAAGRPVRAPNRLPCRTFH